MSTDPLTFKVSYFEPVSNYLTLAAPTGTTGYADLRYLDLQLSGIRVTAWVEMLLQCKWTSVFAHLISRWLYGLT